jgi:hypothetical protein
MSTNWYVTVGKDASLDQGDLIFDCPIVGWKEGPISITQAGTELELLRKQVEIATNDLVVMTQTCDLAESKVHYVILCAHYELDAYRKQWEDSLRRKNEKPSEKGWSKLLDQIAAGRMWNLSLLNSETGQGYTASLRIVDFHEVFSLPRDFIESWLKLQGHTRLRLCPPYREHLSQAFARFFMRVGLPTDLNKTW